MPDSLSKLIVALCCANFAAASALANPNGVLENFQDRKLPEANWSAASGDFSAVSVHNGSLWLSPSKEKPPKLVYRYYALRDRQERKSFEAFKAKLAVKDESSSAGVAFGLSAKDWSLSLELDCAPKPSARLVSETPEGVSKSEWRQVKFAADGTLTLEFAYDPGTGVEAVAGGVPVAAWKGVPPAIVDFSVASIFNEKRQEPARIESLSIDELPKTKAFSQPLQKAGSALPGDAKLDERLSDLGGEFLGGYLWGKGEKPAIEFQAGNLTDGEMPLSLVAKITDWQDKEISSVSVPFTLKAKEIGCVSVPLPDSSYGAFHLNAQLRSKDGVALEAAKSVDFGITAAPLPSEMSQASSVGIHGSYLARTGAKWTRFWDNGKQFFWLGVEKEKGKWDWTEADACLQRTIEAQIEPLIVLAGTPEWASVDKSYVNYLGRGSFSMPESLEDWKEYCRRIAERYKGKVKHYEVWNEPNNSKLADKGYFFYGPVEDYFKLLKAAYEGVKAGDPGALVLAPSGTGHYFPFLERLVELGGLDFFDILSIHTYCVPFPPELGYQFNGEKSYKSRVERSRAIMAKGGKIKPIWNTEIGYHDKAPKLDGVPMRPDQCAKEALPGKWPNTSEGWSFRWGDQRRFAAFIARFYILSSAYGVEKTFLHHRLMESSKGSPYMEAPAVGFFSRLLGEAAYDKEFDLGENAQAHGFKLKDGNYCIALWRVEPETLGMHHESDKKLGKVDSAPLSSLTQASIAATLKQPREGYFFPDRKLPLAAEKLPAGLLKAFDLWGNEIKLMGTLAIEEAPSYLLFKAEPESFAPEIQRGTPPPDPIHEPKASAGSLADLKNASKAPETFEASLPGLIALPMANLKAGESNQVHGATAYLHNKEPLGIPLAPELKAGMARVMLSARCGSHANAYSVSLAGGPKLPLLKWAPWPDKTLGKGKGWSEVQGILISPPMDFNGATGLEVRSSQGEGRVYAAWLWPCDAK